MSRSTVRSFSFWPAAEFTTTLVAVALALLGRPANAATNGADTWVGNTSASWGTGGNWTGANAPPISGDSLIFGAAGSSGTTLTDNLMTPATFNIAGITFNPGAAAFTFNPAASNGFTLTGNVTNNGTNLESINDLIALSGAITFTTDTGGGNLTLGGAVSGTGSLIVAGGGTLTLSSTSNSYTGSTTVNAGTLSLTGTLSSNSSLALGGGTFSFANATTSQTVNGLAVNSGASVITNTNAIATPTLTLGTIKRIVGGTVDFSTATSSTNEVISSNANTNGILGGWATQGGEVTWAVAGASTAITGLASGAYQANTATTLGASATGNTDMTVSGTTTLAAGAAVNSLRFNNAAADTIAITGTLVLTSGGLLETSAVGANANLISGGTLEGTSGGDLVVIQNNSNASGGLTISSVIANNATATALTKSGAGTLTLSNAANTYSGGTIINAGTLSVAADGATNGYLGLVPTAVQPANVTLNGGTLQITATTALGTSTISANRGITLGASGGAINITAIGSGAGVATSAQYRGIIAGASGGNLTISGGPGTNSGTNPYLLQLGGTGTSTYNGNTTVSNAIVAIENTGGPFTNVLPTTTVLNLMSNGWFVLDSGTSKQTIAGLTGDSTGVVGTVNTSSAVVLTIAPATGLSYNFQGVIGPVTLLGSTGTASTLSLVVAGAGTGTQILSGANTYTGATTVNGGVLSLTGSLSATSALAVGGGTFSFANTTTGQTVNGLAVNSGSSVITNTNASASPTLTLGTITRSIGGTVDFSTATSSTNEVISSNPNNAGGILGGWATQGGEATWAVAGASTPISGLALGSYQANTSTTLGASTTGNTDMQVSGTTTLSAATTTVNSLRFNNANADTIAITTGDTLVLTSGGLLETSAVGANANTISGGTLEGGASADLVVIQNNSSAALVISSVIANNTAATALTKSGAGTLTLNSSSSSYSSGTIINAGVLSVAGVDGASTTTGYLGAIPATAATNITINGGTLSLAVGTAANSTAGTSTIAKTRLISLGTNGGTININFTDTITGNHVGSEIALVYNGVISGTGGLTVTGVAGLTAATSTTGASILDLGAPSTYSGNTTISNAIVQANSGTTFLVASVSNILPTSTVLNLINNGTFNMDNSSSNQQVAGLTGDSTGQFGGVNGSAAVTLTLGGSGTYIFPGVIGDFTAEGKGGTVAFPVVKSGTGTQIFSGANTYAGGTTLSAGTLGINSTSAIGTGTFIINGGAIDNTGTVSSSITLSTNNAQTWGTAAVASGFAYGGTGNLNLGTGAVTITGDTRTISTETITANAANAGTTLTVGGTISLATAATAADMLAVAGPGNVTLNGVISNGGTSPATLGVTMNGTGVLVLSNTDSYTGPTVVNAGTLSVTGSLARAIRN